MARHKQHPRRAPIEPGKVAEPIFDDDTMRLWAKDAGYLTEDDQRDFAHEVRSALRWFSATINSDTAEPQQRNELRKVADTGEAFLKALRSLSPTSARRLVGKMMEDLMMPPFNIEALSGIDASTKVPHTTLHGAPGAIAFIARQLADGPTDDRFPHPERASPSGGRVKELAVRLAKIYARKREFNLGQRINRRDGYRYGNRAFGWLVTILSAAMPGLTPSEANEAAEFARSHLPPSLVGPLTLRS